jgi:hypothetical protein
MRLVFWGLVVVSICYLAYSGMIAAWSWIAVQNAVDEIISKEGIDTVPLPDVRTRVLTAANEAGVPITEKDVVVTREDKAVQVEIIWTVPVIIVKGESVLAFPLSVKRTSTSPR